jgi:hypothetical protein
MQLTGELAKISLPNLLQLVKNGELTGKIAMLQGAKTATIFVENGNIIHVESDTGHGKDALMDLFLWLSGSFSFMEQDVKTVERTISHPNSEDTMERLLKEGMAYLEQKKYLDQMHITGQTVLKPTEAARSTVEAVVRSGIVANQSPLMAAMPILENLDGYKTLAEALADSSLSRRAYVQGVYSIISEGLAVVVESTSLRPSEEITLPEWVLARLRQDNPNISQSIVDLVIWVDRVKCWMYQVDADFSRIVEQLAANVVPDPLEDDFYKELAQELDEFQGPLFGESPVPAGESNSDQWPPDDMPQMLPPAQKSDSMGVSKPPPAIEF